MTCALKRIKAQSPIPKNEALAPLAMNIVSAHLDALRAIGYTEVEARFLYLVATHSGVICQETTSHAPFLLTQTFL